MDKEKSAQDERREYHEVRVIFVQACNLLAPLFEAQDKTTRISAFAMGHIVKNNFPELSSTEVRVVVTTIERLKRENRLQALLGK